MQFAQRLAVAALRQAASCLSLPGMGAASTAPPVSRSATQPAGPRRLARLIPKLE
jgi:hypothetical protein